MYLPNSYRKVNKQPQQFAQEVAGQAGINLAKFPRQNAGPARSSNGIFPGKTRRGMPPIAAGHTKIVNPSTHAGKLLGT
jgi:hypothetical protein